jgi:iron(III) transport system ATP-binding protein
VALARALAPRPFAVLLDEPFSNLDDHLRLHVRDEVRAILKQTGISAIFVTHDQHEALLLGDRVGVMRHGRLEQAGAPEVIFHTPETRFVAGFFGRADFVPATVTLRGLETEIGLIPQSAPLNADTPVEVLVRPDDVQIAASADGQGVVLRRLFQGQEVIYCVRLPSGRNVHSLQPHTAGLGPGTRVAVTLAPGHALICFHDGRAVPTNDGDPGPDGRATEPRAGRGSS